MISYTVATILVLAAAVFSLWAGWFVKNTYKKYDRIRNARGITGEDAARRVLSGKGLSHVPISVIGGSLSDYYDPKNDRLCLSESSCSSSSAVAVGVACHECGHAMQYAENYFPAKFRMAIVPVTNFGAKTAWPLILAGAVFSAWIPKAYVLIYVGIALFGLSTLFQLVTLPTEFDASRRALQAIREQNLLEGEDYLAAQKVLTAAALTYVAALAVSLTQLLRLIAMYGNRRKN